jgi:hypothetical protein
MMMIKTLIFIFLMLTKQFYSMENPKIGSARLGNVLTSDNILEIIREYLTVEELLTLRNTRNKKIFLAIQEYYLERKRKHNEVVRKLETLFVSNFEAYVELIRQNHYLDFVEIEIPPRVLDQIILDIEEGFRIDIFEHELIMQLDEAIHPQNHRYFSKRLVNPINKSFLKKTNQNQEHLEHLKIFNISEMQFDGSTWKPTNLKFKIKISKTNDNPHEIELFGQIFPLRGYVIGVNNDNWREVVDSFLISTFGNLDHTKYDKLDVKTTLDKMKTFGIKLNFLFGKNDFDPEFDESLHYVSEKPIGNQFNSMLNYAMNLDHFSCFQNQIQESLVTQLMTPNFYQTMTPNFYPPITLNFFPPMQPYFIPIMAPNFNTMHGPHFPLMNAKTLWLYQISNHTQQFIIYCDLF